MTPLKYAVAVAEKPIRDVCRQTIGRETFYGPLPVKAVPLWAIHHVLVACLAEQRQAGGITLDYWEVAATDGPLASDCRLFVRRCRWTAVQDWAPPVQTIEDVQELLGEDAAA